MGYNISSDFYNLIFPHNNQKMVPTQAFTGTIIRNTSERGYWLSKPSKHAQAQ